MRLPSLPAAASHPRRWRPGAAGEQWSFCPPAMAPSGCEIASFTANASPQMAPAGACLLSYDGTRDQNAFFKMQASLALACWVAALMGATPAA